MTLPARDHAGKHGLHRVDRAEIVDAHDALELFDVGVGEGAVRADPGVVDQDVDRAERPLDLADRALDVVAARDVGHGDRAATSGLLKDRIELIFGPGDETELSAALRGFSRDRAADPARGSGDDGDRRVPTHGRLLPEGGSFGGEAYATQAEACAAVVTAVTFLPAMQMTVDAVSSV